MGPVERKYSQIEKEALAITWAYEHFSQFLQGLTSHILTDHKPLVTLLSSKPLDHRRVRRGFPRFPETPPEVVINYSYANLTRVCTTEWL